MKNAVTTGTLAVLLSSHAAFAGGFVPSTEDAPVTPIAAPVPAGYDWSGFYGGVQLEYGDVEVSGDGEAEGDGALYGLFGGYRYDLGSVVVGAELDLNFAEIDLEDAAGANIGSLDNVYRLGAEVGYDAGPALIYGTAGFAQASANIGGADVEDNGFFFGAGVDYFLTDQIILGAEVLQHEFDDFDGSGLDVSATTFGLNAAFRF